MIIGRSWLLLMICGRVLMGIICIMCTEYILELGLGLGWVNLACNVNSPRSWGFGWDGT